MRPFRALVLGAVLAASLTVAAADTLFTISASTSGVGSEKQESKETVWMGPGKLRHDGDEATQIILAVEKKALFIDHQEKTYSVVPLPVDLAKRVPADQRPMLDQLIAGMKMDVKVTPTDERKKIRGWNVRKYAVALSTATGMKLNVTVWTTTDLKVDAAAFKALSRDVSSMFPGAAQMAAEMDKIEGISVLTETSMAGSAFKRSQELLSVEEKAPPTGTYDPPAGYREAPFDPLARMRQEQQHP
ncbi:MAG: DUF4412 domain-containing protein [Acidobacteriia bacterium]|nr:DUF4412 domain-containing protein [Terriglobia bacterium]